jgi:hypothetical protein
MKAAGVFTISPSSLAASAATVGLILLLGLGAADAQGTPEQQQACQPDAMRLCSEFIPDVPAITKCMVKKRSALSPACRAVFSQPASRRRATRVDTTDPR